MNDRHPSDWDARMRQTAAQLDYPPTPNIAAAVRSRTHPTTSAPRRRVVLRRTLAIIAVALVLLWPLAAPIRAAFERLLRIGAIEIVVATPVPMAPTALPTVTSAQTETAPTATPVQPTATALRSTPQPLLEGQTTLAEARRQVPFTITLPSYPTDLGVPDEVYVQHINGPALIMVWRERGAAEARMSLQVFSSDIIARKWIATATNVQRTTVDGQQAVWIDVPHVLEYGVPGSELDLREGRVVKGNVLLWATDTLTYRLESSLPLEEARRVAESLR